MDQAGVLPRHSQRAADWIRTSERTRRSGARASAVPRLLVRLYLKAVHELVEAAEQVDYGHQLQNSFVVQTQLLHRRSMDLQSVVAGVHCGNRDGDDLLGQSIEFPGLDHHRLDLVPVRL